MRVHVTVIAGIFTATMMLTACGGNDTDAPITATPTTTVAFPYPPVQYYTDVAVPLEEPLLSAANFALEMLVADERVYDPRDADRIRPDFLSRTTPDGYTHGNSNPFQPKDFVDNTGGETLRAVGAQALADGVVEVSICIYNSPGVYTLQKGGDIRGPGLAQPAYGLRRTQVQWTSRPAADGSVSAAPRWLWANNGLRPGTDQWTMASVCDPFKPDPFIQKMPDPTTPTPTPTR